MTRRSIRIEETQGSKPGRREYEVFAPDGYNFGGPHSLVVRDTMKVAQAEARSHVDALVPCEPGCDCGFNDSGPS